MDELQAAILRIKLRHLDADNEKRRKLAAIYSENLPKQLVQRPEIRPHATHVFHLYVVQTDKRSELMAYLKAHDIHAGIHYPQPVHLQPAYKARVRTAASMKNTELLANRVMSLPIYPELGAHEVKSVVAAIRSGTVS